MINLFLMAQHPRYWFCALCWLPKVHCEIITGRNQSLNNFTLNGSCLEESLLGLGDLLFIAAWYLASVIMVCRSNNEIGRQCEMVDPMGMCVERVCKSSILRIPYFHRFIMRSGVYKPSSTPLDTRNRTFVSAQYQFNCLLIRRPYSHSSIFRCGR